MTARTKTWKTWNVTVRIVSRTTGVQDITVQASGTNAHDARRSAERKAAQGRSDARAIVAISSRRV